MKIVDLKTFVVGNPWKNWVFVKLYTDEGITGLGEATGGLSTKPQQADVEELKRHVIDEDPCQPERLWCKMHKARFGVELNGEEALKYSYDEKNSYAFLKKVGKLDGRRKSNHF